MADWQTDLKTISSMLMKVSNSFIPGSLNNVDAKPMVINVNDKCRKGLTYIVIDNLPFDIVRN